MSEDDLKVPEELFKDVKFYVVGDIEQKVHWTVMSYSFSIWLILVYWLVLAQRLVNTNTQILLKTRGYVWANYI